MRFHTGLFSREQKHFILFLEKPNRRVGLTAKVSGSHPRGGASVEMKQHEVIFVFVFLLKQYVSISAINIECLGPKETSPLFKVEALTRFDKGSHFLMSAIRKTNGSIQKPKHWVATPVFIQRCVLLQIWISKTAIWTVLPRCTRTTHQRKEIGLKHLMNHFSQGLLKSFCRVLTFI